MLVISALMASSAALTVVVIEATDWQDIWFDGLVMFLATAANQAVFTAMLSWVAAYAPERHRATMIGFGELMVAAGSALVGAALGVIAHSSAAAVGVIYLLGLNLAAAVTARRITPSPRDMAEGRSE